MNKHTDFQDKTAGTQLTVMTDRTLGGSSIHDGQLEIMVLLHFGILNISYKIIYIV